MIEAILLQHVREAVLEAGRQIEHYATRKGAMNITLKTDASPVTEADQAAHRVLVQALKDITPTIAVISEEDEPSHTLFGKSSLFWLIDPLDGTREFIDGRTEYTVNLALIEHHMPVWGVVYLPASDTLYWGGKDFGAWRKIGQENEHILRVQPSIEEETRVLVSYSHRDEATQAWIHALGPHRCVYAGSSLKFCRIAEGEADLYPRLQSLCAWDIAAGQALLEGAGGEVVDLSGRPLRYDQLTVRMPSFVARARLQSSSF